MTNIFKPINKEKLISEVSNQLKSVIKKGYYKIGDKLPTERELAEKLNVSRATIREVLKKLQNEGLLEIRRGPYGGAYIVDMLTIPIIENYKNLIYMDKANFTDIIEARLYIEPNMAKYAACNHQKKDTDNLYDILKKAENAIEHSIVEARQLNIKFHCEIAKLLNNSIMYQHCESIIKVFSELLYEITDENINAKALEKPFNEHYDILTAIKNNDSDNAYKYTKVHLLNAYETYAKYIINVDENFVKERIISLNSCL